MGDVSADHTLLEPTARRLSRLAVAAQRQGRVPGLHASVVHGGRALWQEGVGVARIGSGEPPSEDHQFLIASNTKTFVATMVLQQRDEGLLSLEDHIADHVPGVATPLRVREVLSHLSGLQREPVGEVWQSLVHPDLTALLEGLGEAERVLPPGEEWHYSNLAYAVLGHLVGHLDGRDWTESLAQRLLGPLGMSRTTVGLSGLQVTGYATFPWHDVPRAEPVLDLRATGPAGALASTARDLATWSHFIARPVEGVLAEQTMAQMCRPRTLIDSQSWSRAMGLGLFLVRTAGGRVVVGHTGSMPGHGSVVLTDRDSGVGAVVLVNGLPCGPIAGLATALIDAVLDDDPPPLPAWQPGAEVPPELEPLLGPWWAEGVPWVLSVHAGRLEARSPAAGDSQPPCTFEEIGPDLYRTTSGGERGELLAVHRDASGAVERLSWATYAMTRQPLAFGEL